MKCFVQLEMKFWLTFLIHQNSSEFCDLVQVEPIFFIQFFKTDSELKKSLICQTLITRTMRFNQLIMFVKHFEILRWKVLWKQRALNQWEERRTRLVVPA